jgi:hypothetical protein
MAAGVRDDVGHEYTCFMRGGEDARLHERFSGGARYCSSTSPGGEDLEIQEPVVCRYASAFHFHPALPRMLGSTLIRYQVVEVR